MGKKSTLLEYKNENLGQIVKITKDEKGRRYLEVDFASGAKAALEKLVEDSPLKGALKFAMKMVPTDYHLDEVVKVEAVSSPDGIRLEEKNGDFYIVEMPKPEAERFVKMIDQSTDLMAGID